MPNPTQQEISDYLDQTLPDFPSVPRDVAERLIGAESSGDSSAVSPKGARGLTQLMPGTAREMGVTDPSDWKQNVRGGVGYLAKQIDRFGSVPLGVAAYHAGPSAVAKARGIPNTSDGLSTTPDYVKKIAGPYLKKTSDTADTSGPDDAQQPYRGDDTGIAATPARTPSPAKRGLTALRQAPDLTPPEGSVIATLGEPEQKDTDTHLLSDTGKAIAAGAAGIGTVVGQGIKYVGDKTGFPGATEAGTAIRDVSQSAEDSWRESMSPEGRQALDNPLLTEDLQLGPTPLKTIYFQSMNMLPSLAAMGGVGGATIKGFEAVNAATRLARIMEAGGAPAAAAAKASGYVTRGAAFGGSQGVYMGLQAAAGAENQVNNLPPDQLEGSEAYKQAFSATDPNLPLPRRLEIAREEVAKQVGDQVFTRSAALFGVTGLLTGGGIFNEWARPEAAGVLRRMGTSAAVDAGILTPQMVGQQVITNQANKEFVNPETSLWAGVPNAAAGGITTGALFGGVAGARGARAAEPGARRPGLPAPETENRAAETPAPVSETQTAPGETPPPETPATPPGVHLAEGDVGRSKDNAPFKTEHAARFAGQKKGLLETHDVAPVEGGFVLRAKAEQAVDTTTGEVTQPAATGMGEGDIGRNSDGLPFASKTAATKALNDKFGGKDLFVSKIGDGQYVLRKTAKPTSAEAPTPNEVPVNPELGAAPTDEAIAGMHDQANEDLANQRQFDRKRPAEVSAPAETPAPAAEAPAAPTADIGRKSDGKPFASARAAQLALKSQKTPHEVVPVDGGFVLRPQFETPVDQAAHAAATSPANEKPEPTQAQKEAGNYEKGHTTIGGLDVTIENPIGSVRKSKPGAKTEWRTTMHDHYGYIKRTEGADGDHVDAYIKGGTPEDYHGPVFVVDQKNPETGKFDEHKVMLGYDGSMEASSAYRRNFSKGWEGMGPLTQTTMDGFKHWLERGDTTQPFSKFGMSAKKAEAPEVPASGKPAASESAKQEVTAPKGQLYAEWGDQRHPVESLGDARAKWEKFRDASGAGVSQIGNGVEVKDSDGNLVGKVSYNGQMWNGEGAKVGPPRGLVEKKATPQVPALEGMTPLGAKAEPDKLTTAGRKQAFLDAGKAPAQAERLSKVGEQHLSPAEKAILDKALEGEVMPAKLTPAEEGHAAAGRADPRTPPKYNNADDKKAWLKAYDKNTFIPPRDEDEGPAITVQVGDKAPMGKAADGADLFQDANGVRSRVEDGIRVTEPVTLIPTREGLKLGVDPAQRADEFKTPDEVGALNPAEERPTMKEQAPQEGDDATATDQPRSAKHGADETPAPAPETASPATGERPARRGRKAEGERVRPDAGLFDEQSEPAAPRAGSEPPGQRERPDAGAGRVERAGAGDRAGVSGRVRKQLPDGIADYHPEPGALEREGSWMQAAHNNVSALELARKLDTEGRHATPEEQKVLSKFVGWGSSELANKLFKHLDVVDGGKTIDLRYLEGQWEQLAKRINDALTPAEIATAARSTQNAHYTSEPVVREIWKAMDRLGFGGGRILEPGMGTGNFPMLMPKEMADKSHYTGIEFDKGTAAIAKHLLPEQNIISGDYTQLKLPNGYFDAAVGNPPFAKTAILTDPAYKRHRFPLHDYFFAKTIDKVRPGGLLTFVTSRYTMDKGSERARAYLADKADLLGAIRLPNTAFKGNAGTEVVTDVLFFRRRFDGEPAGGQKWDGLKEVKTSDGKTHLVNEYFADHPEMVLGEHSHEGSMYGSEEYTVAPRDGPIGEQFAKAVAKLPKDQYRAATPSSDLAEKKTFERDLTPKAEKEGQVYVGDDGNLYRRESGAGRRLEEVKGMAGSKAEWMKSYVGLRDLMKQARYDQLTDGEWQKSLKELNKNYDAFVKQHGPINDFTERSRTEIDEHGNEHEIVTRTLKNANLLRLDVEGPLVESLERISSDGKITKGPFLVDRVLKKPIPPKIETPQDALAVSLSDRGRLDLDHVAELSGKSRGEVIKALGDGLYKDPGSDWKLADEYLSGDVVTKLEEARIAAGSDPQFERNVEALHKVQPKPLKAEDVTVGLGAHWIDPHYLSSFADEVLDTPTNAKYNRATGQWEIEGSASRSGRGVSSQWGTTRRSPAELLDAAANGRTVKVVDVIKDSGGQRTVVDEEGTAQANEIVRKMREAFKSWIWKDAKRAGDVLEFYNRKYNNIAPRTFDGSHMQLPGLAEQIRGKLYDHQKRAIWRMVQTGNTYLAHAVGAGKTLEMIVGGMEQRRLGLVNKPMYVVPNHMLNQFAREFLEAYPAADVMVADEENFHTSNRKRFVAQAAMNNPDAIIITHSAFGKLGAPKEAAKQVLARLTDELQAVLDDMPKDQRRTRKQIEQRMEQLEQRFLSRVGGEGRDDVVGLDEMGVDHLVVDEAHEFRKLDFATNHTNVKGIDPNGSMKALDLYIKTKALEEINPGRSHTFASGTPVTNTLGELYNIMRFMDEPTLERDGLSSFDSWATQFGETATFDERNAAGNYDVVERFAKFVNVPELMSRVRSFMDVLTSNQLGGLVKLPKVEGGEPQIKLSEPSPGLKEYMTNVLAKRIETSRAWKPSRDEPNNPDPLINIITDGRLAATDLRFVRGGLDDDPQSKLNDMISKIVEQHKALDKVEFTDAGTGKAAPIKGAAQIVFAAVGFGEAVAKNRGFDARGWVMKRLKEGGIDPSQVAWMSDYNTHAKKEAMFRKVRDGQVRVLFGSPKNMGTGMNVQTRLAALHYLNPPWFPSDVEQPHGRILRQGNQNENIALNWYATKGTYDSTQWQMIARKARFIEQTFTGGADVRRIDDISPAGQYEQASALASGDERVIKYSRLQRDVESLERLGSAHASEQIDLRRRKDSLHYSIRLNEGTERELAGALADVGTRAYYTRNSPATIGGRKLEGYSDVGAAMVTEVEKLRGFASYEKGKNRAGPYDVGKLDDKYPISVEFSKHFEGKGSTAVLHLEVGAADVRIGELDSGEEVNTQKAVALSRGLFEFKDDLRGRHQAMQDRLAEQKDELKKVEGRIGAPFERQQELLDKISETARLRDELVNTGQSAPEAELTKEAKALERGRWEGEGGRIAPEAQAEPEMAEAGQFSRSGKSPTELEARRKASFDDVWTDDHGKPEFYGDGFAAIARREISAKTDFDEENGLHFGHAAHVDPDAKVFEFTLRHAGKVVGSMMAETKGEKITAVHDIVVDPKARGLGVGEKVIRAILAHSDEPVRIVDMVPSAEGFWRKMGYRGDFDENNYRSGSISWDDYAKASAERGASPGAVGPKFSRRESAPLHPGTEGPPQEARGVADHQTTPADAGVSLSALREHATQIGEKWNGGPSIEVVRSVNDLPVENAPRDARGYYSPDGKMYLVADNIHDLGEAQFTIFHETFHDAVDRIPGVGAGLQQLYQRNQNVRAAAAQWRRDNPQGSRSDASYRRLSINEALADLGARSQTISGLDRFVAALQKGLRAIGLDRVADWLEQRTDAEALTFVSDAIRRTTEAAKRPELERTPEGAFSRDEQQTEKPEFKRWFGKSIVKDADGKPLVVYRGEHGDAGDEEFHTRSGSLTFGSAEAASRYAQHPNDEMDGEPKAARVMPVYLKVEKPIVNAPDDPFIDVATLKAALGEKEALRLARRYAFAAEGTNNWQDEINAGGKYASVKDFLDAHPERASELYFDVYNLLDDADEVAKLRAAGFDGAIYGGSGATAGEPEYRVFDQSQVKSAIGNRGTFDDSRNTLFSRATAAAPGAIPGLGVRKQDLTQGVTDLFKKYSDFNWLHQSFATQFHKGEVSKDFKRVFDEGQNLVNDTSQLAMDASDYAPDWLPRLTKLADVLKRGPAKLDREAASRALYDGTLAGENAFDGKVWSDDVLRARGLSDTAIDLYHQARAAVDRSLDDTATSLAARHARRIPGFDADVVERAKYNPDQARQLYEDEINRQLDAAGGESNEMPNPDRARHIQSVGRDIDKAFQTANDLKAAGYFPLKRWGKYTTYAYTPDEDGAGQTTHHFSMTDSKAENERVARALREHYPEATVETGTHGTEAYKMMEGISPDTLAVFAAALGASDKEIYQKYLKLAISDHSALKGLLERKGTPGFERDVSRTLAGFITSNARFGSRNYHMEHMVQAAENIPKNLGKVKDEAAKLVTYLQHPDSEAPALRGLMFMNFLGGSVASALTNATQPVLQTLPHLARYESTASATKRLLRASKIALGGKIENRELAAAMARADREGITSPHELYQLYAETIQGLGNNLAWRKFQRAWGSFFSLAETFNRRITFAAAYELGKEMTPAALRAASASDAYHFATRAVAETQSIYNRGNRPNWARGPVGATLFTFKQFTIQYVEFIARLPAPQKALALSLLVGASGVQGLPFAQDIEDVIDTVGQSLGWNTNSKAWLRRKATTVLGQGAGEFITRGVTGIPGMPFDMQGRLGMGNIIPGSDLLKPSNKDKTKSLAEFAGPLGTMVGEIGNAYNALQAGKPGGALRALAPVAVQNVLKGVEMAQTGAAHNERGQKTVSVTAVDAMFKALGLNPYVVAKDSADRGEFYQYKDMMAEVKSALLNKLATARIEGDAAAEKAGWEKLREWNQKNPGTPVQLTQPQVRQEVRQRSLDAKQRLIKGFPKSARGEVAAELQ